MNWHSILYRSSSSHTALQSHYDVPTNDGESKRREIWWNVSVKESTDVVTHTFRLFHTFSTVNVNVVNCDHFVSGIEASSCECFTCDNRCRVHVLTVRRETIKFAFILSHSYVLYCTCSHDMNECMLRCASAGQRFPFWLGMNIIEHVFLYAKWPKLVLISLIVLISRKIEWTLCPCT